MKRLMLNDELWSKLRKIMLQHSIYDKSNLRLMVEGMLYRMRVGCPWRDLPAEFGNWQTIYQKFNRWALKDKFMIFFKILSKDSDLEWKFIDGTVVKAHQSSAGAANTNKDEQAIGRSSAGNSTKIHMAVDAHGLPIDFELTGGQVHECKIAEAFIERLPFTDYTIADKGYDSEEVRLLIHNKKSISIIPRKSNSKKGNFDFDWDLYNHRHLIENFFARIKQYRSIATRYDKLLQNYKAMLALACSYLWLPFV